MKKEKIERWAWGALAGMILTMIIGFSMGGWVLGGTAVRQGEEMARDAVINRLAPICLAQFNQDPEREGKLREFQSINVWNTEKFVKDQGWATMPFEKEPDDLVADACTALIKRNN
jgi:Ni/Fe-hydrogenase subunit HybB-like protein